MGRTKLKDPHPLTMRIREGDYVLYCKELHQVTDIYGVKYSLIRIKDKVIITSKCLELGMYEAIYAKDLIKIDSKAAKILYGV